MEKRDRFYVIHNTPVFLGRAGEENAREAAFDLAPWRELYGPGSVLLLARRPGEAVMYPVPLVLEGDLAIWKITGADVAKVGQTGECELSYIPDDDTLAKSETWTTFVLPSMDGTVVDPPDAAVAWVDALRKAAAANEQIAERAALSATEAAQSAGTAGGRAAAAAKSAEEAAKNAVTAGSMAAAAAKSAESAAGSAEEAKTAKTSAQKAAAQATEASQHYPFPHEGTGTWWVWDAENGAYKDSGVSANPGYQIGSGLKLDAATNTLSVDTADAVEEDNTKPITSAAVFVEVGNIEALLAAL